jgi:outer membrane immunogenic protein
MRRDQEIGYGAFGMRLLRLVLALAVAQIAVPALAAPQTTAIPFTWTGFYAGANGGLGFGSHCWNFYELAPGLQDQGCDNVTGGLGGGQLGFNWQTGRTVLGLEVSGDWGKVSGSHVPSVSSQGTESTSISQIVMLTGRAGYAFDQFLIYGKGGVAFVRQHLERTCNGVTSTGTCTPVGTLSSYGDQVRQSFVIGGGLEYAFARNFSVAIDYSYLPMGAQDAGYTGVGPYTCGAAGAGKKCGMEGNEKLSVVTVRLNWLLGVP